MDAPSEEGRVVANGPTRGAGTWRGRLRRYGPLAAWVGFIFFASTGSLSASNTSRIIRPLLLWLFPEITEAELLSAHTLVRKSAHLIEYAVLGLLASRAFRSSSRPRLRSWWHVSALALVAACALLDEYHQSFEPTRTGTVYDSVIDVIGGVCAVAAVAWWTRRRRK